MTIVKFYILILFFFCTSLVFAQTDGSGLREVEPGRSGEFQVNEILEDSGKYFKEGLLGLANNRRKEAREKFDESVEIFLSSGINVRSNGKLQACYSQLIETVYRLEFPSAYYQPQIKPLSQTCGWNIDNSFVDQVMKMSQPGQTPLSTSSEKNSPTTTFISKQSSAPSNGFSEQKFDPSPLDELSKVELSENIKKSESASTTKKTGVITDYSISPLIWTPILRFPGRNCPMPSLQKIMPGDSVAQTEKTLGRKLAFTADKTTGGQVGLTVAGLYLPGTKLVRIRAFKNRIYDVAVIYDNLVNWTDLTEFATTSSKNLQLPNYWKFYGLSGSIVCERFEITALKLNKYYALVVADSEIDSEIYSAVEARNRERQAQIMKKRQELEAETARKRREKELEEQRKKATFKP